MSAPEPPLTISVIVPVYNSETALAELVTRLENVMAVTASAYEIILIDDASRDRSWDIARNLARSRETVRAVRMMRNYGQAEAVLAGIRMAEFEIIVTMDDDLQHPPEEIPRLVAKLIEGHDVVYGVPERKRHGFLRVLASELTKIVLQNAMGAETARNISPFRAFRTVIREGFDQYRGSFVSIDVLLTWSTTRFASIRVREDERRDGVSNYTVRKLVIFAVDMITGFSILPLQLASLSGFICAGFGIIVLCLVLFRWYVEGSSVPGFPFLASIIAIFSGVQMLMIGVIGEYLARMHFRGMNRPQYLIREIEEKSPGMKRTNIS